MCVRRRARQTKRPNGRLLVDRFAVWRYVNSYLVFLSIVLKCSYEIIHCESDRAVSKHHLRTLVRS
jgi:hypothetical protein